MRKKTDTATDTANENRPDSLRERVYQYLKDAMSAGRLSYGEFLDQDKICETLEVSKTPLRDALIRLEAEGFVTILPRKGVHINPITPDFIKSAYQIIGSIEADCLNEVFGKLTAYHVRQFEASNERQWELLKQNNFVEYYDENIRFHGIFLSLSENILLEQTLIPLRRRLYDFPRRQYSYEWESMNLLTHQRFIDSVRFGNREAAVSIFRTEHWSYDIHKKYFRLYYNFDASAPRSRTK